MKASSTAFVATVIVSFVFLGCSQQRKDTILEDNASHSHIAATRPAPSETSEAKDAGSLRNQDDKPGSPIRQSMSSSAAILDGKDSSHWFISTVEIKFETKNVASSTYKIEDNIRQLGGYVSYTNLTSTVKGSNLIAVSTDSSLRTTNYEMQNTMTIRVPNTQLDSALKCLAPLASYLDYRLVKANDVALQVMANKLKQARIANHEARINRATDEPGKKLSDISDAQQALLNKQEDADNAKIENLSLTNQVKFSTINLSIYQPEAVERQLVFNEKNVKAFEPALTARLAEAAQFGFSLLESIMVFVVRIWPLIFIAIVMMLGYRRVRRVAL